MSQIEKIVQFHISRLKDRSVEVQLNTIRELELLGAQAEAALPALKELFETTEDENVQRAAQRAGYTIFQKVKEQRQQEK